MIAIVAVDKNCAIGNKGDLLISLPEDQKGVFRKYTAGNTVVYGRKTLKTFKDEKLLPKRSQCQNVMCVEELHLLNILQYEPYLLHLNVQIHLF